MRSRGVEALAAAVLLVLTVSVAPVAAVDAPHVPTETDTDVCAMCHRAHTSASDATWTALSDPLTDRSALLVGSSTNVGDTDLCFSCHGVDALGSTLDVQDGFTSESSHTLVPFSSAYGPSPKQCSSCHDSHGTDRLPGGDPYPALLRSFASTDPASVEFGGDEYCATCHADRPADVWDGLAVWDLTAHALEITPTASGTDIVCSACHDPHGSDNPPTIVETLYPPAIAATTTVSANDRTFCQSCHAAESATWTGTSVYATSAHAVSEATVTAVGEWASSEDTRTVGECQNCHAPMGSSDGEGGVIPKLVEKIGREQCYTCHSATSEVSAIASDLAQFAFPASEIIKPELAVAYDALRLGDVFGRVSVYSQETTGSVPHDLVGPREFPVGGRSQDMAAGDVDGDGRSDLVVADSSARRLVVYSRDDLEGIVPVAYSIGATPTLVAVGDLFVDGGGRAEVAVVSRSETAPFTSRLYVYRYDGSTLATVAAMASGEPVGTDATGIAVGALSGTDADDVVVTSAGDSSIRVFSESTVTSDTFGAPDVIPAGDGVRGPSIGDANASWAGNEIVVANSGETVSTLSLFSADGASSVSYEATLTPGAYAWDTLVANVLPGHAGAETIVALRSTVDTSGVNVFPRLVGGGLGAAQAYETGRYYATSSLDAGDVDSDADGDAELIVANAGTWAENDTTRRAPSIQVFRSTVLGTALDDAPTTYSAGGVELAGNTPALAVVDLGAFGRSRHPVSVVENAHVSTETAPFTRHVECVDCHNVHESTATVAPAPLAYGAIRGTWGVGVLNAPVGSYTYTQKPGVSYEYELCFKCHSGWTLAVGSAGDIASQVDTRNASFHAIETSTTAAQNTAGSFVSATPAWSTSSVLHCVDCHGNSAAGEPSGPHSSAAAPLLSSPLWGQAPSSSTVLCYRCHKYSVYYTAAEDTTTTASNSNFYDVNTGLKLHYLHVNQKGFRCDSCHAGHGSADQHLVRTGLDWVHADSGGACYTPCHGGSTANAYSRAVTVTTPSAFAVTVGSSTLPTSVVDVQAQDGTVLRVDEVTGAPGFAVIFEFSGVPSPPASFSFYGRYQGNVGHTVVVQAWNYATSSWVTLGALPAGSVDDVYTYPMASNSAYESGGQSRIRINHTSPGNVNHYLRVDYAWLRQ